MSRETILIDTSAWIPSFRKAGNAELKAFLISSIRQGTAATAPMIILELLQGCRTEEERDGLRDKLESIIVLGIGSPEWEQAYQLGSTLRREGLTVPTADLLIAAIAIENRCILVHMDRHFESIAGKSKLQTRAFG